MDNKLIACPHQLSSVNGDFEVKAPGSFFLATVSNKSVQILPIFNGDNKFAFPLFLTYFSVNIVL